MKTTLLKWACMVIAGVVLVGCEDPPSPYEISRMERELTELGFEIGMAEKSLGRELEAGPAALQAERLRSAKLASDKMVEEAESLGIDRVTARRWVELGAKTMRER